MCFVVSISFFTIRGYHTQRTVKRVIVVVIVLALIAAAVLWKLRQGSHDEQGKASETKPAEEEQSRVTHDESGRAVVKLDDKTRDKLGLKVAKLEPSQESRELTGYGRVLDPAPLASLVTELAAAQAAAMASSNELDRLRMLVKEQNTSERALQVAEAAARRDTLAIQSTKERLALSWGPSIGEETNLPALLQSLTERKAVLIRIDLPVGVTLSNAPTGARIATLSGKSAEAKFLGTASNVDPQTLGHGTIYVLQPDALGLMFGEAVTGYAQLPGAPESGVIVPDPAVVRSEGRGWVYVANGSGEAFTRTEIPLERPVAEGWFVSVGLSTNTAVVVTGAQTLLSEEMKSSLKSD